MGVVERVSPDDLMSLATDHGDSPMQVGAALILDTSSGCSPSALIAAVEQRVPAVPRLRQRLDYPPSVFGRPIWIDDPRFRIHDHFSIAHSLTGRGMDDLLSIASDLVTTRLPRDRPLWAAVVVPGMADGRTGLVIVFHHVLADGLAGLAILAALAGGSADLSDTDFPRPAPTRWQLACASAHEGLSGIRRFPLTVLRMSHALGQLGPSLTGRVARSSLNQPIKGRPHFATVSCDLAGAIEASHARDVTINDLVLSAIAGTLRRLLFERGESATEFVISVPFSPHPQSPRGSLGNQSGAIPIRLPAIDDPLERLRAVAAATKAAKRSERGASTALLGPLFRGLAKAGLYQWFVDHQRVVHTFVTNIRGPQSTLRLGGYPVDAIVPLTVTVGNVTVSFAVLSYAGTLTVTVASDPATCPDIATLTDALASEITALTGRAVN